MRHEPVLVILTTSNAPSDVTRACSLHANSHLAKSVSFERFRLLMKDLRHYWLGGNATPRTQE